MPVVKNRQLINEVANGRSTKHSLNQKQIKFVIDRYFDHSINALSNGYSVPSSKLLNFRLAYITYPEIPKKLKKHFTYSNKVFGYTFLPVCANNFLEDNGYNFKPCKSILEKITEVTETDSIYLMMQK